MVEDLPRREREILEVLCGLGEATGAEIRASMEAPPSDSTVRTLLARLERRGMVRHEVVDHAHRYRPTMGTDAIRTSVLSRMVSTLFAGSGADAAVALLGIERRPTDEDIAAIETALQALRARKR